LRHLAAAAALWLLATRAGAQAPGPDTTAPAGKTEPPWWVAAELHLSVLSNLVDRSTVNLTFGYAANFGYRWRNDWGVYVHVEHNMWTATELDVNVLQGAFDVGIGGERLFFRRRMRAALAVGPAVLLYNTALDDAGTTGLYIDARPAGVRWPLGKGFVITLDPLTFTIVAPALGGIPLVQIQYRTALAVEYDLAL
jgi:hypothetical protein